MKEIETPSDVILRVSAATGVPVAEIAGDSLRQEALDARMMVAWLCARAKRWRLRDVSVSLNRSYDQVKRLVRSAERAWSRNHDWGIMASAILREVGERKTAIEKAVAASAEDPVGKLLRAASPPPPTVRVGTRMKLNRETQLALRLGDRAKVAVPPAPPAKPKPLSANSKHGPAVAAGETEVDMGFTSHDSGYRYRAEQHNRFCEAMIAAGYKMYVVDANGQHQPVRPPSAEAA